MVFALSPFESSLLGSGRVQQVTKYATAVNLSSIDIARYHRRNRYFWCGTLIDGGTPSESSFLVFSFKKFHTKEEEGEDLLLYCYYY